MAIKSKKIKIGTRQRMKFRIRKRITGSETCPRLSVFRSGQHIYAQAIEDLSGKTLASASTLEKEVMGRVGSVSEEMIRKSDQAVPLKFINDSKSSKGIRAAFAVGMVIAERLKALKRDGVVFDRNGFLYHGRIKAVAEGARAGGLQF